MAIIAPFWATTDDYVAFKAGHSKMYYHVYRQTSRQKNNKTSDILTLASQHVRLYAEKEKFANFKATWALVVTWVNLCPYVHYPWYYNSNWNIPELNCKWVSIMQLFSVKGETYQSLAFPNVLDTTFNRGTLVRSNH